MTLPPSLNVCEKAGNFTHAITVCDSETDAKCPIFAGITKRLNWPFPDPEDAIGFHEKKISQVQEIRDQIKEKKYQLYWLNP